MVQFFERAVWSPPIMLDVSPKTIWFINHRLLLPGLLDVDSVSFPKISVRRKKKLEFHWFGLQSLMLMLNISLVRIQIQMVQISFLRLVLQPVCSCRVLMLLLLFNKSNCLEVCLVLVNAFLMSVGGAQWQIRLEPNPIQKAPWPSG